MKPLSLLISVCLFVSAGCPATAQHETPPPNIVFILADDLGYSDLSCYGSDYFQTPRLDDLAEQGVRFTDAYANCANCAPTRAALMSGQYAPRTGVYTVNTSARGPANQRRVIPTPNTTTLSADVVTLAEVIQSAGYTTCHIGKWHLGEGDTTGPQGQGFDINIAGNHRGHPSSYFSPYRNPDLADGPEGEYLTHRLTDEAIGFIEGHRDAPFFLYLPYYTVHTPIQPYSDDLARLQAREPGEVHTNARYGAMVEGIDTQVGRILDALDEMGLAKNTIVVFMSDNGGKSPETDMLPLRGSKGMFYEGGIRVPLIVRWPGVAEAGSENATPVITLDFYPTLVAAAGGELPDATAIDGEDLGPILRDSGADLGRDAIYWHFPAYLNGYRGMVEEGYRRGWRATPCSAIRSGDWKLIEYFEDGGVELFNLASDPGEAENIAEQSPEKAREMLGMLRAWQAEVDAPWQFEDNPDFAP